MEQSKIIATLETYQPLLCKEEEAGPELYIRLHAQVALQSMAKSARCSTALAPRWCGYSSKKSRKERKKRLAGRPNPRVKWE